MLCAERKRGRGRGRGGSRGRGRRSYSGPETHALEPRPNLDGVPLDAATLLSQPRVRLSGLSLSQSRLHPLSCLPLLNGSGWQSNLNSESIKALCIVIKGEAELTDVSVCCRVQTLPSHRQRCGVWVFCLTTRQQTPLLSQQVPFCPHTVLTPTVSMHESPLRGCMQHLCFPEAKCVHLMWSCQTFLFAGERAEVCRDDRERLHSELGCVRTCCEVAEVDVLSRKLVKKANVSRLLNGCVCSQVPRHRGLCCRCHQSHTLQCPSRPSRCTC